MYKVFISIVVIHFIEHLTQLYQLYVLHWTRPECLGLISLRYPWLMRSEWLHYSFALYMAVGLTYFGYKATNKKWWRISCLLQDYHHVEHLILSFFQKKTLSFTDGMNFEQCFKYVIIKLSNQ